MERDDTIKYNLDVYLPYILECVDATYLLQNLESYSGVQRRELSKLSRAQPCEATKKAFEILMKCESLGVFTELLRLFEEDYPKIAKLLKGDVVKCDANYRHIIKIFTTEIIQRIQPIELIIHLRRYDVITDEEAEEVRAEEQNYGPTRASWLLITNIYRHIEEWFKYFLMSLIDTGFEDLAELLDKDMLEKIKAQREFDSEDEDTNEDQFYDVREYIEEETHVLTVGSKLLASARSLTYLPVTVVKVDDSKCSGDETEYSERVNIAGNNKKEFKDSKVLYGRQNLDESTTKKQQGFAQDETESTPDVHMNNLKSDASLNNSDDAEYSNISDRGNIIINKHGELTNTKLLYTREDHDDITSLKQAITFEDHDDITSLKQAITFEDHDDITSLKQAITFEDKDREPVEHTDDESDDESEDSNDLNKDSLESDNNSDARNIKTDVDEITDVEEHVIELRGYQNTLAQKGCEGENVMIMAPTNSGKTKVACMIVQEVFKLCKQQGKTQKAAFIVDKEELAFQQGKVFETELPGYRTKVITGDVQQSKNQHLKEYIHRRDVLVITAQVLLNCLKAKEIESLDVFSIIVFDECHHADKKHPYKKIMDSYFEQKLENALNLPQIVGLTASIGVGGKLDRNIAFENMKQIAANLDVMAVCTVDDEEDRVEMKTYINDPDESLVTVPRRSTERFYQDLLDAVERIDTFMAENRNITSLDKDDRFMKDISRVPTTKIGTPQFQSWISDFKKGIAILKSNGAMQILSPCRCYLEQYHQAIMIYNDARIRDALKSLQDFVAERRQAEYNNEADMFLLQLFDDIQFKSYADEPENPKLVELERIVLETMKGDENARGIIFVRTKVLARILKKWMHERDTMKELNARIFLGRKDKGMTPNKRQDALTLFKNGKHKIIIATTVAEEGLDIAKCNLVINYEHETNENARVQRRGRARAVNSKYYVVTEEGSNIVEKVDYNARCEKLMEELIPRLKSYIDENRNKWIDEVLQMQRNAKQVRETQNRQQQARLTEETVNLHCGNCGTLICSSDDIKKVCGMHHIVVNSKVREKIVLRKSLKPKHEDSTHEIIMGGDTFCSNKQCVYKHKLGGIMQYKLMEFPVLAIKNICLKTLAGKPLPPARQWSKVCFKVESIDTADLMIFVSQESVDLDLV